MIISCSIVAIIDVYCSVMVAKVRLSLREFGKKVTKEIRFDWKALLGAITASSSKADSVLFHIANQNGTETCDKFIITNRQTTGEIVRT